MKFVAYVWFLTLFLFNSAYAAEKCSYGFSGSWSLDQKNKKIVLEKIFPQEVCRDIKDQQNSNFEILFYDQNKKVYNMKVYWAVKTFHDLADKNKLHPLVVEKTDYKIIKVPLDVQKIVSYEIKYLPSNEIWGKGKLL